MVTFLSHQTLPISVDTFCFIFHVSVMNNNKGAMVLLAQGAEARVYETTLCGRPAILKERVVKKYRLPDLDSR